MVVNLLRGLQPPMKYPATLPLELAMNPGAPSAKMMGGYPRKRKNAVYQGAELESPDGTSFPQAISTLRDSLSLSQNGADPRPFQGSKWIF